MACVSVCNYSAIADADSDGNAGGKRHVEIIQVKCQGCGVCVAVCKGKAITLAGYSDDEMYEEIAL